VTTEPQVTDVVSPDHAQHLRLLEALIFAGTQALDEKELADRLPNDADGLRTFAAACEQHALDVCVHDHPAVPASGSQSTIDAVAGLHGATSSTGEVLASRIRSTALPRLRPPAVRTLR